MVQSASSKLISAPSVMIDIPVIDSTRTVMEASKELLDAAFDNATRALQIDSMYPEQRTACEYILNGLRYLPDGLWKVHHLSMSAISDEISSQLRYGFSLCVL